MNDRSYNQEIEFLDVKFVTNDGLLFWTKCINAERAKKIANHLEATMDFKFNSSTRIFIDGNKGVPEMYVHHLQIHSSVKENWVKATLKDQRMMRKY